MDSMEGGSASALSPAAAGGRRHHSKKMSAAGIRRTLKKLGIKPKGRVVLKGGADPAGAAPAGDAAPVTQEAGRRHRKTKKHSRKSRGYRLF